MRHHNKPNSLPCQKIWRYTRRAGGVCNSWAEHPKSLDALQKAVKPLYCEFPLVRDPAGVKGAYRGILHKTGARRGQSHFR